MGGRALPIPISPIKDYCEFREIKSPAAKEEIFNIVAALDDVYIPTVARLQAVAADKK